MPRIEGHSVSTYLVSSFSSLREPPAENGSLGLHVGWLAIEALAMLSGIQTGSSAPVLKYHCPFSGLSSSGSGADWAICCSGGLLRDLRDLVLDPWACARVFVLAVAAEADAFSAGLAERSFLRRRLAIAFCNLDACFISDVSPYNVGGTCTYWSPSLPSERLDRLALRVRLIDRGGGSAAILALAEDVRSACSLGSLSRALNALANVALTSPSKEGGDAWRKGSAAAGVPEVESPCTASFLARISCCLSLLNSAASRDFIASISFLRLAADWARALICSSSSDLSCDRRRSRSL